MHAEYPHKVSQRLKALHVPVNSLLVLYPYVSEATKYKF